MKTETIIAPTSKGARIFLENVLSATGRPQGQRYNVVFSPDSIHILFATDGKRAVVSSKNGVIDLQSKKVTQWAQGATRATVHATTAQIIIQRAA
jgi:hypothetical protein